MPQQAEDKVGQESNHRSGASLVAQRTPGRPSVGGADGPAQARGARPNDLIEIFGASKHVGPVRVLAAHMFRRSEVPRTERDRSRSHPKTSSRTAWRRHNA